MDFYTVLARVIESLQREGRTSYRALKRQFTLDDEYLADLKVELTEVKKLAVDQDGTMLVWTGAAPSQRATQEVRLAPTTPLPTAPPPAEPRAWLTPCQCSPYHCTLLAAVSDHLGYPEDGLQALAEAQTLIDQHEECWWEAEVSRLRGILLLRQTETLQAEAEAWLQRAPDVARRQEATSLELRAAMSLSRLWQQQGMQAEARELLAPVYRWFTEGCDTADLQEARALLEALA